MLKILIMALLFPAVAFAEESGYAHLGFFVVILLILFSIGLVVFVIWALKYFILRIYKALKKKK